MGVCTKERKGVTAEVLMATPCTNSLEGESGGHKHEGCGGRKLCWKFAAVSWPGRSDWTLSSYRITENKQEILIGLSRPSPSEENCEADSRRMYRLVVVS